MSQLKVGRIEFNTHPVKFKPERMDVTVLGTNPPQRREIVGVSELWPLIQALERACWKRKWSEVKTARKALEAHLGKRPHDTFGATDK